MNRTANSALVVWTLASVCAVASAVGSSESFEDGLGGWAKDGAAIGRPDLSAGVTMVNTPVHSGRWGTVLNIDGGNASSAVWLEKRFVAAPGEHTVTLTFWVWSPTRTDAHAADVLASIGPADPETRADLSVVGRTGVEAGWAQHSLRKQITLAPGESVWVGVGFGLNSAANQKFVFDDVTVEITPLRDGCAADFDGSGSVTAADLAEFLSKWLSGSPAADFNTSGGLDMLDIFEFLRAWQAGCETRG